MPGVAKRKRKRPPAAASGRAAAAAKALAPRRYDPADTRTRILESAGHLFATRGYPTTGTAEIAARAGVSEGSIFYHFGSKNALLVELGRLHGMKLVAAMEAQDQPDRLTLADSIDRCFGFVEEGARRREAGGPAGAAPEPEPFLAAAREIVVGWIKGHLDARHELQGDTMVVAQLVFAVVAEAIRQYLTPGLSRGGKRLVRAECARFLTAAVGAPRLG